MKSLQAQEVGLWEFGTGIRVSNRFKFQEMNNLNLTVIDRLTKKPVSYLFRFEVTEMESGNFILTTCASSKNASRHRKFDTAGEAVAVGYAWLNRRFVVKQVN